VTVAPTPVQIGRPLRILVVDDQPVQCELISHALQRDWHTIAVAGNGRERWDSSSGTNTISFITDKAMPGMNGDQLAVAVKSLEPETRVIMLTGFGSSTEDDPDSQSEFVDLILAKPASLAELRAAIAKVMA